MPVFLTAAARLGLVLLGLAAPAYRSSAQPAAPHPDLPMSERAFPAGPGVELVTNNCTACHSPGMILTQPKLTRAEWTGEVNKMVRVYKAPVRQEDVAGIVDYLAELKVAP